MFIWEMSFSTKNVLRKQLPINTWNHCCNWIMFLLLIISKSHVLSNLLYLLVKEGLWKNPLNHKNNEKNNWLWRYWWHQSYNRKTKSCRNLSSCYFYHVVLKHLSGKGIRSCAFDELLQTYWGLKIFWWCN